MLLLHSLCSTTISSWNDGAATARPGGPGTHPLNYLLTIFLGRPYLPER
eukprot:COSAG04_NODE_1248_length_7581_cov_24.589453_4_plen_49_part_00